MKFIKNDYTFYKIVCDDVPEFVYIGSTCNFIRRKSQHKGACNNPTNRCHNLKLYQTILEHGGWDKWDMIIIDKLDQSTLLDARIREEELRLKYNGNLNMVKAHITTEELIEHKKEYRQENKLELSEQQKEYRQLNKEAIKEHQKEYRQLNKEAIKEKDKLYRQISKDKIKEKAKEYYNLNKESLNEKMTCDCGATFSKHNLPRHKRSIKHQNYCETIDLS